MECKDLAIQFMNGEQMPLIGFGTYQIKGEKLIKEVLDYALAAGYRSIDTAFVYRNECEIGLALKQLLPKYGLQRKDIYITSKLSPNHHGDRALHGLKKSLANLDCGYLDLYLIHWPGQGGTPVDRSNNSLVRRKTWENLVKAQRDGLVKTIGVSNYTVNHLKELLEYSFGVIPAVNQIEWHPHYHPEDIHEFCKQEGIHLQAYSSLGGTNNPALLNDADVVAIANEVEKSPAQVLLRWAIQQNIGIIPKARSQKYIYENIDLNFELDENHLNILNNLPQRKYAWDPAAIQ